MLCAFEKHLPGISTSGTGWFQDSALRSSPPRKGAQQKLPQHLPLRDLPFPCPQWLLPPPLSAVFSSPFLCLADFHFPGPSNKLHPAAAFELSPHFLPSAPCRPRTVTLPPPPRGGALLPMEPRPWPGYLRPRTLIFHQLGSENSTRCGRQAGY